MKQLLEPIEPKENFVPVLSLHRRLSFFAQKYHWSPQRGADDLDEYEVVLVGHRGKRFLLLRYAGAPDEMVDLYIPARMPNYKHYLKQIVEALRVPTHEVIDRNTNYERF